MPVLQEHGDIPSLGFRFGNVAYSADLNGMPDESVGGAGRASISGSWMRSRHTPHPSHFSCRDAWPGSSGSSRSGPILTNMHADLDYEALRETLPAHVVPAYDGMQIRSEVAQTQSLQVQLSIFKSLNMAVDRYKESCSRITQ